MISLLSQRVPPIVLLTLRDVMIWGETLGTAATPTRHNRTITVDFQDEATYFRLLHDGKAFVEFVLALVLALGFQLTHTASCRGGGWLTRHSHYVRVRLGGLTIWRIQCTRCKAVIGIESCFQ